MSLVSDIEQDLGNVFFSDFAVNCLLTRAAGGEEGISCMIDAGVDRFINEAYIKHKWEAVVKVSDGIKKNDVLQVLGEDGMPTARYIIGDLVSREGDTKIFEAKKTKLA